MQDMQDIILFDNSLTQWGIAVLICAGTVAGLKILQAIGIKNLHTLATRIEAKWLENLLSTLGRTKIFLMLVAGIWAGSFALSLPEKADTLIRSALVIILMVQVGLWAVMFMNAWIEDYRERNRTTNPAALTSIGAVGFIGKLVVWSAVLLMVLSNLGIDITALIAGLGIGGIAVALAVQNILGDLFASMTIVLDKPFVIGDFLIMGEHMGVVEYIGLKSTRIRSISGEQIILSNTELLNSRIRNYGRMYERRVPVEIGVTYQTPREKLEKIPAIIRAAVEKQDKTRFDRAHFKAYGAFSLNFEYVYYVTAADFTLYMDVQQAINFDIHAAFEREGIDFAYPTQTLFVEGVKPA